MPYPDGPLDIEDHFRIVKIAPGKGEETLCCELISATLSSAPAYEALSYAWGDPAPTRTILLENIKATGNRDFPVAENCYHALLRLRLPDKPRIVWIDAICINQSEISERNHQLGLMGQIYRQAARVVIYLGEATDDSDQAIEWISEIDAPSDYGESAYALRNELGNRVLKPDMTVMESFFRRPWFKRVWVLQEAAMAKDAVVYCGDKSINFEAFKAFRYWNASQKWLKSLPYVVESTTAREREEPDPEKVLKKLNATRPDLSTDPRDKLYALLPLLFTSNIDPDLIPDYGLTPAQVFTKLALYLMRHFGIEILRYVSGPSELPGLPSWVPDWSRITQSMVITKFNAGYLQSGEEPEKPPAQYWTIEGQVNGSYGLRTPAIQLGKIQKLGERCNIQHDYFPVAQWQSLAKPSDLEVSAEDRKRGWLSNNRSDLRLTVSKFNRTIAMDFIIYPDAIERGVERLLEYEKEEQHTEPIRKAINFMAYSYVRQVKAILDKCDGRRFFVGDDDNLGLAPAEAQCGDYVLIFPGANTPFVVRKMNACFRLVGHCYVQGVMKGESMAGVDISALEKVLIM